MINSEELEFRAKVSSFDWPKILARALSRGGVWADIFWERNRGTVLASRQKALRQLSGGLDEGVGLRILSFEGRSVYASTNDLSMEALLDLAQRLSSSLSVGNQLDSTARAPLSLQLRKSSLGFPIERWPSKTPLNEKIALLKRAEAPCWLHSKAVRQVEASLVDSHRQIFVARSDGQSAFDDKSYLGLRLQVTLADHEGKSRQASHQIGGFWGFEQFEKESPEMLATETLRQGDVLLKAIPAPSGALPVVLGSEAGGTMCHEAVGHGLEADLAEQGLSVYAKKIGQKVASEKITLVDDGTLPYLRGSHAVDDEGCPTQRTTLIEKGILKSYLFDHKMALRKGRSSTGNGRRQTYRHEPMVRMTNTFIAPGEDSPADILRAAPWGLYVARMGGGQVDTVSGNFVFHVTEAYLIREGEIAEAVLGATVVGNGPQVLREVQMVGSDLGFANGTCGKNGQSAPVTSAQPTLLIPRLTVGGMVPVKEYFPGRS